MPADSTADTDLDQLIDLNGDYIRSVQLMDVQRFDEILSDDFVCSNPTVPWSDRAAFLEQTARPIAISGLEAREVDVRLMGDFAIIHARTTYTLPDGPPGRWPLHRHLGPSQRPLAMRRRPRHAVLSLRHRLEERKIMAIKLYDSAFSPFARKVRMVLEHKGLHVRGRGRAAQVESRRPARP